MRLALLLALMLLATGCGDDAGTTTPATTPPPADGTAHASGGGADAPEGDPAPALSGGGALDAELLKRLETAMAAGRAFLAERQDESGGWGDASMKIPVSSGYTGMAALGLMAATPRSEVRDDEQILKALRYIAANQVDSGAIDDMPEYRNYQTGVAVGAWALARMPEFRNNQVKARDYLVRSQITADESDPSYGGFPYKQETKGQPADLSNMNIAAQGLADAELPRGHALWTAMQRYLQRVQNNSEVNDFTKTLEQDGETIEVVSGNDGGAHYYPGNSKVGETDGLVKRSDGKYEPKSYGSMSYALLKCLIFAGVPPEDRRMQMVVKWISDHWTMERHPGFEGLEDAETKSQQGYFYYVYTAARALAEYEQLTGKPLVITDAQGRKHDWRRELVEALLARQGEDGSWVNPVDRWNEGSKVLVTGYALQALAFVTGRLP